MKFSEKLTKLRKSNHYSQEQLASLLDVSRQAVSKWESGQTYPEMDKLLSMCKIFKCSLDDLTNDEITEDEINNKKKNNVVNVLYEILEMISKTFAMVKSMNFKQIFQWLFEMGILLIILLILKIPFDYVIHLGNSVFLNFGDTAYQFLSSLWNFILNIIYIILFIVVSVFIYKTRYLDKFEEKEEELFVHEEKEVLEETFITPNKKLKPKKQHSFVLFDILGNLALLFIKFMTFCIGVPFVFTIIGFFFLLIVSIVLIFKGVFYIGIILGILCLIILNYMILELIFYFIFNGKIKIQKIFIMFMTGIIGVGIASGIAFFEITSTKYMDESPISDKVTHTEEFIMDEKGLFFDNMYSYYYDIEWVFDDTYVDKVKVDVMYYSDYVDVNIVKDIHHNILVYTDTKSSYIVDVMNRIIDDLKSKKIYNYSLLSDVNILVTTSETTYQKMENLRKAYYEEMEETDRNNQYQYYEDKIHELETSIDTLNEQNYELKLENEELNDRIEEYRNSLESILEH